MTVLTMTKSRSGERIRECPYQSNSFVGSFGDIDMKRQTLKRLNLATAEQKGADLCLHLSLLPL